MTNFVNSLYVLTAGHCVCIQMSYSNVECDEYGTMQYDPKEVIRVYIGLNDENIKDLEKRSDVHKFRHSIDSVIKHENWDGSGLTTPDLALIKLAKKVLFTNNPFYSMNIIPACMPDKNVELYGSEVFVNGWGRTRNEGCFTDNNGPNRSS